MWLSESRRRARFQGAKAAYDLRGDPLWDGPDPEPEELNEPEEQPHVLPDGKGLEADQA